MGTYKEAGDWKHGQETADCFGKPGKVIFFWQCFIMQRRTNPVALREIWDGKPEGNQAAESRLQSCVSFGGHGSCCLFQRAPRATCPPKALKDGFVRLLPTSQLQASRQRGTGGKWQHRGAVGTAGRQGLGGRGCGRIWTGASPIGPGQGENASDSRQGRTGDGMFHT